MNPQAEFRALTHRIAEGLTSENVAMIRYLCRDAVKHSMQFTDGLHFFEYFETKGWINLSDMSFLAEVLYRINRHDLLKRLPGVKNRRDYEQHFLNSEDAQNFTPFRIACFQLIDELTVSDLNVLKNFCRPKLSKRNYDRSVDVISLLVCLEEEDLISDGDLEFILSCLEHLDNQVPYSTFRRLSEGDHSIVLPKMHQRQHLSYSEPPRRGQSSFHHSQSLPSAEKHLRVNISSKSDSKLSNIANPNYPHSHQNNFPQNSSGQEKFFLGANFTNPNAPDDEERTFFEEQLQKEQSHLSQRLNFSLGSSDHLLHQTNPHEIGLSQPSDDTAIKDVPPPAKSCRAINNLPPDFKSLERKNFQPTHVELPEEAVKPSMSSNQLNTNKNTYETNEKQSQLLKSYPMKNVPCGICLIINNCTFETCGDSSKPHGTNSEAVLKNRVGSEKDVEKVKKLFDLFGFDVKLFQDLKAIDILAKLNEIANISHENFDCFVLVIMTHGGLSKVYGVDQNSILLADIKKCFKPESCPSLEGKPKIMFIQACQTNTACTSQSETPVADLELDGLSNSPEADFLICYSTVPGYPSYRSRSVGSFFIQLVVKNLAKYYKSCDLLGIMVHVNNEIANLKLGQIAMPVPTVRKKIYFHCSKPELLLPLLE